MTPRIKSLPRRIKRNINRAKLLDARSAAHSRRIHAGAEDNPMNYLPRNIKEARAKKAYDLRKKGYHRSRGMLQGALVGGSIGAGAGIGSAINRHNKRKDPNNPRYRELNALLDDAIEFGTIGQGMRKSIGQGMRKFKRNLDIGGRGMKAARQRVNMVPLHEYVNPGIGGSRSERARLALIMRQRARTRTRGAVIGAGVGGVIGTHEGLRQNKNRKKNER